MQIPLSVLPLLIVSHVAAAATPADVASAAARFYPAAKWTATSVLFADFTCRGREETAVLGVSPMNIVVAVFLDGLAKKPQILEYSAKSRNAATAKLSTESLGGTIEDWKADVGFVPEGLEPSNRCVGLNLSDGEVDSAHIYWNHHAHQFSDWVR